MKRTTSRHRKKLHTSGKDHETKIKRLILLRLDGEAAPVQKWTKRTRQPQHQQYEQHLSLISPPLLFLSLLSPLASSLPFYVAFCLRILSISPIRKWVAPAPIGGVLGVAVHAGADTPQMELGTQFAQAVTVHAYGINAR